MIIMIKKLWIIDDHFGAIYLMFLHEIDGNCACFGNNIVLFVFLEGGKMRDYKPHWFPCCSSNVPECFVS